MAGRISTSEYMAYRAIAKGIPLDGTFELSPCCNMNCRMCYVRKSAEDVQKQGGLISPQKWIAIGRELKEMGLLYLLLTGGEPFLYSGFRQVYETFHDMGIVLAINSNGTLIDEETVGWLKRRAPFSVNITLYGGSRETYARLCNYPDGFDRAVRAIHLLKDAGITVKINATMTPYNIGDLQFIRQMGLELNAPVQYSSYSFPAVRKDEANVGRGDRFTVREYAECKKQIRQLRMSKEEKQELAKAVYYHDFSGLDTESSCDQERIEGVRCHAGRCSFWINWKGEMLPCGVVAKPRTYPLTQGLQEAWEQLRNEVAQIRLPRKCTECDMREVCDVCMAVCSTETGGFEEAPQYLCDGMKEYVSVWRAEYHSESDSVEEEMKREEKL